MPTIKEIAQHAGVSIGTVSNVLNGLETVRPEARAQVMRAVEKLGYEPSVLGRALRRDKTNIIVMIVPDITNPFFPGVVRGAEDTAFQSGFRLVLCNSDNDPLKEEVYLREMRSYRPAGLILVPSHLSRSMDGVRAYEEGGSCVVYLDRVPPKWRGNFVTTGHEEGAYAITSYLIELGHKKIATVAGPTSTISGAGRLAGYHRAMKSAGLTVDPKYVSEASDYTRNDGFTLTRELLSLRVRPTAVFAGNDLLAFGALAAVRDIGLHCPHDISIVGFDNLSDSDDVVPPLTTVDQSVYELGATASRIITDHANGKKRNVQHVLLPSVLRIKGSSGPRLSPKRRQK